MSSLGLSGTGIGHVYLAGATGAIPQVNNMAKQEHTDSVHGTIDEFRALHVDDAVVQARLVNKVKVCAKCGKPCAYTLKSCNACGSGLADVAITHNDNVFMGFIYGIGKGRFPYTISMRKQTPEFLCFDDPLSLSALHLNAIPTTVYCPDLRYLFTDPPRGLQLLNDLFRIGAETSIDQFWADPNFRKFYFGDRPVPTTTDALTNVALCGMNFPPSMYQLHLQFIHPPMLPFQFNQAVQGNHFHHGRFFPLEYLRAALALGDKAKMSISEATDVSEIIDKMNGLGVNYDEMQVGLLRRCEEMQAVYAPWKEENFTSYVVNGHVFSVNGMEKGTGDPKDIQKQDVTLLQNYGRPYSDQGKPTGTYYKYPKAPADIIAFAK